MDEVEIKFRLSGPEEHERLRAALLSLGAQRQRAEEEENRLYDNDAEQIEQAGGVLRLRILDGGPRAKVTYKGPASYQGAVKSRRELEFEASHAETAHALLEALGYRVTLTYAKERETWTAGEAEVVLDTLDFGHFCEIEGPAETITTLAAQLGLPESQIEPRGYASLSEQHRTRG